MARFLKRIHVFAAFLAVTVLLRKGMNRDRDVGATVKRGPMQDASILQFAVITARPQKMQYQGNVVSFSRNANANSAMTPSESIHAIAHVLIRSIPSYVFRG
ncbi:hypothetical protein E2542_SST04186 [Spatholobus suberectus]|nr:hypothetical protein E2542_SST04186 [Spatholobus suberectus]